MDPLYLTINSWMSQGILLGGLCIGTLGIYFIDQPLLSIV